MFELEIRAKEAFSLFRYQPSLAAAAIFIALFAVTTVYHVFQAARKRTYYFIPLIVGGVFEVVGYVGRVLATKNQNSLGIFILQSVTLLVAPALFAASIYMILGRIVLLTQAEAYSPIKARWLTKIFVFGDVLSFLVQSGGVYFHADYMISIYGTWSKSIFHSDYMTSTYGTWSKSLLKRGSFEELGGGMMAKESSQKLGKNLVLIGLFIQIVFFGFFLVCSGLVHVRLNRNPTPASTQASWAKHLYMLYLAGILILIRSLFRVAEFAGGHDGPLQSHEIYLYIFDAVLMLGVMVAFNIVHPGSIIGRKAQNEGFMLGDRDRSSAEALAYERK